MLKDFKGKGVLLIGLLHCPCGCDSTLYVRNYTRAAHYFMELGCKVYNPTKFFCSSNIYLCILQCIYYFLVSDYIVFLNSYDRSSYFVRVLRTLGKFFGKELVYQDFFGNYGV